MSLKILLADDHMIVRRGLSILLNNEQDMEVVAQAENGQAAVELAAKLSPDIVVMDIAMPDLNGIEAARRILARNPAIHIIALSVHSEKQFVVEMFRAGASGYILKDCAFEELTQAIHAVTKNRKYLSPAIAHIVLEGCLRHESRSASSAYALLTPRERQVLQLLSEGWKTRNIAAYLKVSTKTVESHRLHIMRKLNLHNIAGLTKYAVREGLTSL